MKQLTRFAALFVLLLAGTVILYAQEPAVWTRGLTLTTGNVTLSNGNVVVAGTSFGKVVFEGATADAYETSLAVTDPTADRTITFPNLTGTVALTAADVAMTPATNDGAALGSATVSWSDLFLASGGVLNWANGDVTLTHASGKLTLSADDVLQFGATATDALMMGAGTSVTPISTATADKNFLGFWTKSTATSGDSRGMYLRHYISGAGGAGEALRAFGTVDAAASAGGTVNGAHISLSIATGGSAAGASHAIRGTYGMAASTNVGGTPSVLQLDSDFGGSATVPALMSYISFDGVGTAPTTNGIPYLFTITNSDDGLFGNASGTGAGACAQTGGVIFTKTLKVRVDGTDYWIGLCNAQ